MGGACGTHGGEDKCIEVLFGKLEKPRSDFGIHSKMIIK
jgi:hypothetical protein